VPPSKFGGAASARTLDLLKKLEPDIKQSIASFFRDRRFHSGMVRPSPHGDRMQQDG